MFPRSPISKVSAYAVFGLALGAAALWQRSSYGVGAQVYRIDPSPTGDDGASFRRYVELAKQQAVTLQLAPDATYHFVDTVDTGLKLSMKRTHVKISGTRNLTITTAACPASDDCPPAKLVFSDPQAAGMYFSENTNLALTNLVFDYSGTLQARAQVLCVYFDSSSGKPKLDSFDVAVDPELDLASAPFSTATYPGVFGLKTSADGIQHIYWNVFALPPASKDCVWAERILTAAAVPAKSAFRIYANGKDPSKCSENVALRFIDQGTAEAVGIKVGEQVLFSPRSAGAVNFFRGNTNVFLGNVAYRAGGSIATMWTRNRGSITLSKLSIKPLAGSGNVLSTNGGGVIALNGTATFNILNSEFEGLGDDAINIVRRFSRFGLKDPENPRNSKNKITDTGFEVYDDEISFDYEVGDVLVLVNKKTGEIGPWRATVTSAVVDDEKNFTWTLGVDNPLKTTPPKEMQLVTLSSGDLNVVGNSFSRSRGTCARIRMRNAKFVSNTATEMPAQCIVAGMDTIWGEGPFPSGLVIRSNKISAADPANVNFHVANLVTIATVTAGLNGVPAYARGDLVPMAGLDISGNTWTNPSSYPIFIDNADTGSVENNSFYFKQPSIFSKTPALIYDPQYSRVRLGTARIYY